MTKSKEGKNKNLCKMIAGQIENMTKKDSSDISKEKEEILLALLKEEVPFQEQCKEIGVERLQAYVNAWESSQGAEIQDGYAIGCKLIETENKQGFWIEDKEKSHFEIFKFEMQNTEFFQEIKKMLLENKMLTNNVLENYRNYMSIGIGQAFMDQAEEQGLDFERLCVEDVKKIVNGLAGKAIFLFEEDILRQKIDALKQEIALLEEKIKKYQIQEKELLALIRVRKKELYSLEEKKKENTPFVKKEGKNSPHEQNKKKKNRGNKKKT